jgi:hypothetical protein
MEERVLEALLRPETYGPDVAKVRLLQTHTSWVFLTGSYAYKVKKPVDFGFLNYTTLEARKHFCEGELKLNRLLSPDIYLSVVAITETNFGIKLGGRGKVLEYAVKMRELPQRSMMSERLHQGEVGYGVIDEIAQKLARFHRAAATGPEVDRYGAPETIRYNWDENFEQTRDLCGNLIPEPTYDAIREAIQRFSSENEGLFQARIAANKVRQCHGDLHSGNIFIAEKVYIFDCIEFNPRFACSDIASEVAFLAMDLDFHSRKDLADFFIERYIEYSQDPSLLRLLDFYKCYRAYVRGKVTSFKLKDKGIGEKERNEAFKLSKEYFELAAHYIRTIFDPVRLLVVMGLPGVGKTYLARRLAWRLNSFHLRSDLVRKLLAGVPVEAHGRFGFQEGLYSPQMSERVYQELFRRARTYLSQSRTCILDATFARRTYRVQIAEIAQKIGLEPIFIHSLCPEPVVLERLAQRQAEPDASDATPGVYYRLKERFEPLGPECRSLIEIDTAQDLETILNTILAQING